MNEIDTLKKRVSELEQRLNAVIREVCPTFQYIETEVECLVRTMGPDRAAKEINRRNRLRRLCSYDAFKTL